MAAWRSWTAPCASTTGRTRSTPSSPAVAPASPRSSNTGVPFAFTDDGSGLLSAPRNNVRYFYAVTAFDVNSFVSGPASLESQRTARAVVPVNQASNVTTAVAAARTFGWRDGTELSRSRRRPSRSIRRPAGSAGRRRRRRCGAGRRPSRRWSRRCCRRSSLTATIDSVLSRSTDVRRGPGQLPRLCAPSSSSPSTGRAATAAVPDDRRTGRSPPIAAKRPPAAEAQLGVLPGGPDPASAARYGIPEGAASFNAAVQATLPNNIRSSAQENQQAPPRLLTNVSPGGSRWFDGANESVDDPAYSIRVGHVTGVDSIWAPLSHTDQNPLHAGVQAPALDDAACRCLPHFLGANGRQADIELTWGDGGTMASVEDITHHLDVPFSPARRRRAGASSRTTTPTARSTGWTSSTLRVWSRRCTPSTAARVLRRPGARSRRCRAPAGADG